jgi:hypothetical protein
MALGRGFPSRFNGPAQIQKLIGICLPPDLNNSPAQSRLISSCLRSGIWILIEVNCFGCWSRLFRFAQCHFSQWQCNQKHSGKLCEQISRQSFSLNIPASSYSIPKLNHQLSTTGKSLFHLSFIINH